VVGALLVPALLLACGETINDGGSGAGGHGAGGLATGGTLGSGAAAPSGGTSASGGAQASGGSGGQSASSGGQGSGGQGSGGESPLCPGVVPECEPGVQGCSERGETYLCTECGAMDLQGESCVRLLVSDKELGQVCAVRGETELLCAGGPLDWNTELEFPLALAEFPSVFRLPDDASTLSGLGYCWIDEGGDLGCSADLTVPAGSDCTDLALSDSWNTGSLGTCTLCAGQLDCTTGTSELSVEDVAQVALSDTTPFWLTSDGSIHDPYGEEPVLTGSYSSLIAHDNGLPCGIRDDGALVCGVYATGSDPAQQLVLEGDFVRGSASLLGVCVIDTSGAVSCFSLEGESFEPAFSPEGNEFVEVALTNAKACGLTRAGVVVCWDGEGLLDEFSAKLN